MLSDLRFRLRALFSRSTVERELDDELRFHLEHETEKHMRAGMSRVDAERRARVEFGGVERIKDDTRDARGLALLDSLGQDLRYALRGLRSKPGFTAAVVATLGLGIGANAAMFGIVDRLLLRPPAYLVDADRVHRVYLHYETPLGSRTDGTFQYARYEDLTRWTTAFDRTAAFAYMRFAIGTGSDVREMPVGAVSATFFDFFDARPVIGRFFLPDEDRTPMGALVVVISQTLWDTRFAGDSAVLGTSLQIGARVYTIIGVAPADFVGVTDEAAPAAFIPITAYAGARNNTYYKQYGWSWLQMLVRRKPQVTGETATADVTNAYQRSWEAQRSQTAQMPPADSARARASIAPAQLSRGPNASASSRVVTWVMGVAVVVLLIACANVANLLLARGLARRREIAVRLALGVTRRRLLAQLLTESLLLAAIGGAAGLAAAQWGGTALRALFLRAEDARAVLTDGRTLLFAGAATFAVALLTGLAPTLYALRSNVSSALKAGAREGTYRRSRLRSGLLLFQAAFCVVLLVGAGLFVRSLRHVQALRLGYDIEHLVYIQGSLRGTRLDSGQTSALSERLLEAARATPGVRAATIAVSVPFWSNEGRGVPFVPGRDSLGARGMFLVQGGSPSYFETMGTRVLRGRGFTGSDNATSERVALVTESMARLVWPGEDPIGKQMRIGNEQVPFTTIVGMVEDTHARAMTDPKEFWYFVPIAQYMAHYGEASPQIFARVAGEASGHLETLRRRLQREMPGASYVTTRTLESMVAPERQSWRFGATMFVAFGALALVLAAIGLYSVIAYAVAQRSHELGVRIALGASVGDVVRMIVGQGVAFAIAGVAIGSAIALWAGRWIEPLLFEQKARDPMIFAAVGVVLVAVAVIATLRPAMRATRVDPTVALRSD